MIGDKTVLFMANHGITTMGESMAEAYDRLYYVERAAQVQIYAMWTGQTLEAASRRRGGEDQARHRRRRLVRRPIAGAAALRCLEAHPRSRGTGLRGVGAGPQGEAASAPHPEERARSERVSKDAPGPHGSRRPPSARSSR